MDSPSTWKRTLFGLVVLVLVLGAFALAFRSLGASTNPAAVTTPLPSGTVPMSPYPPIPTVTLNSWAATKQALDATAHARPTPNLTPQPTVLKPTPTGLGSGTSTPRVYVPIPGSTPAGAGAIVYVQPPFPSGEYQIENEWYEDVAGNTRRVFVYAGGIPNTNGQPSTRGVVVVWVSQIAGTPDGPGGTYLTPVEAGSVHIAGAVGERLILQSALGSTFYFDVPTRQFVASLDVTAVPTAATSTSAP